MPRLRYNWRQDLSQPRPIQQPQTPPVQVIDPLQQQAREAAINRAAAAEAHARYQLGKEIETDRQRTAFYNGLQELEQNLNAQGYPIGTRQHAEAYAAYAHEFPLARSSSDVDQTLKLHAVVNDDQAALTQRMQQKIAAGQALGLQPEGATFVKGNDVDVRFTKGGTAAVPNNVAQRYAKLQADILFHQEKSKDEEAANIKAGNADVPYTQAPKLHASQFEAQALEKQFPALVPQTDTGQDQSPSDQPVITPAQAPINTPTQDQMTPVDQNADVTTPAPQQPQIPTVGSKDEYDSLPGGSQFMSNGKMFVKPQETPQPTEEQ